MTLLRPGASGPGTLLLTLGEKVTRESGTKVTDVQGRSQGTITALMTVAIYYQSMGGSADGAHRAGLILGERPRWKPCWTSITTPLHKCAGLTAGHLEVAVGW